MKRVFLVLSVLLLLINGSGAMYGGGSLILDPTGNQLHLSGSVLDHTPFRDFLIPGIVLFVVNGIFSLAIIGFILLRSSNYPLLIFTEGCLLTAWIFVEYVCTKLYHPLQIVMGATGLLLIFCGYELKLIKGHV